VFTQADAGSGDILMVKDSLGRPAKKVSIDATADVTVKFNTVHSLYPLRQPGDGFSEPDTGYRHLGNAQEYIASGEIDSYVLTAGETLDLDGDFPVEDIMLVSGATDFTILCS
jgi:hypothetical protein